MKLQNGHSFSRSCSDLKPCSYVKVDNRKKRCQVKACNTLKGLGNRFEDFHKGKAGDFKLCLIYVLQIYIILLLVESLKMSENMFMLY